MFDRAHEFLLGMNAPLLVDPSDTGLHGSRPMAGWPQQAQLPPYVSLDFVHVLEDVLALDDHLHAQVLAYGLQLLLGRVEVRHLRV